MVNKDNPILNVNHKSQSKRVTKSRTKTKINNKPKGKGKKSKNKQKQMPKWRIYAIAFAIVLFFLFFFYYFYIRPYSYRWRPCYGFREYGVCMPFGYQIHGLDISRYQGNINWDVLKMGQSERYPLHFIFFKATEGGDLQDRTFSYNFESARRHGFVRGAYHFYIPSTSPIKQADFFINTVKLKKGDLPPVLDIEVTGKRKSEGLKEDLKIWLKRIEDHYKVKPIIYASFKFKKQHLTDSIFDTYPYWIAHYYIDSVAYQGEWKFWQHTDLGVIPGIPEKVDLNIFNGTLEELNRITIQ